MLRRIITIDEEKCTGCGLCARACHEGAIAIVDGKARLVREHFCDGLGDCLPACPENAITFTQREAPAYDPEAVRQAAEAGARMARRQWPVQLKLTPTRSPAFAGRELVVAADCAAYVCPEVYRRYLDGRAVLIGCPKLDGVDYSGKLAQILQENDLTGVTVVRMEVPCCGGLTAAVRKAMESSGSRLSCRVVIVSVDGTVLQEG